MFPATKPPEPFTPRALERPTSNMSRRRSENTVAARSTAAGDEEFSNDGIDDEELVKASFHDLDFDHIDNYANPTDSITRKNTAKNASKSKGRAKPVETVLEEENSEPKQRDNGKWACNHKCKNKTACKHMCCRDGLDKPPKKTGLKRIASNESGSQSKPKELGAKDAKPQTKLRLSSSKRKSSAAIEELDLTQQEKKRRAGYALHGPKDYRDLHKLHKSIQNRDPPSSISSIMRQKPAYCYGKGGEHSLSFLKDDPAAERPGSISSDYGDIQVDELSAELEHSKPSIIRSTVNKTQDAMELDDVMGSPIENTAPDRQSDTFSDGDSIFADALIGLADSEYLRTADQPNEEDLQALEESLNTDCDVDLHDEDFPANIGGAATKTKEQSIAPEDISTSSGEVPRMPPAKPRSLFLNDTSSPHPAYDGFKPAKSMLKRPPPKDLKQAKNQRPRVEQNSNGEWEDGDAQEPSSMTNPEPRTSVNIEPRGVPISEAFKDLEPWLFKEFGDIVELVD